ncbi:tetratricopeptide repeat-containing protein [Acinetobacter baumannii]
MNPNDSYLIQRLTLATYKAEKPNKVMALMEALQVLNPLDYKTSNDPETTGLAGAINKRLWQETQTKEFLEEAIVAYKRGFILKKDYYNGENLVLCNLLMSNLYDETSTLRTYHLVEAEKVIKDVLASIEKIFDSSSPELREDYKWILATAANLSFFINQDHMKYEERFLTLADEWEVKTYRESQEIFSSFKVT